MEKTEESNNREEFILKCDCVGGGDDCSQIRVLLFTDENDLAYVSIMPKTSLHGFFNRIKMAWNLLIYGKWLVFDELVIDKNTIDSWASELMSISNKMKRL